MALLLGCMGTGNVKEGRKEPSSLPIVPLLAMPTLGIIPNNDMDIWSTKLM